MSSKYKVSVIEHGGGRSLSRIVEREWRPHLGENLLIYGDYYLIDWVGFDPFDPDSIPEVGVHTDALDIDLLSEKEGWTREGF